MAVDRPVGINDPSGAYTYDAATWRRAQSALLAHGDDLRSASAGVLHGLEVTVEDGVTTVGLGSAVVTPAVGANGSYIAVVSAVETVTVPATSSGDRWDRIVLRVQDPEVSGSTRAANILRVAGSEASSPSIPSAPSGTLPLARVRVTTSGASYAVDERVWTAPVGGVIPVADEDLYPSGFAARPGQLVYETYSDLLRVRTTTGQWSTVTLGRREVFNSVFTSLTSGITVLSSVAVKDTDPSGVATVTLSARLSGVTFPSGTQNTSLGVVRAEIGPNGVDVPLACVSGNGSQRVNITNGSMAIRWSAEARTGADTRISGSWVLD